MKRKSPKVLALSVAVLLGGLALTGLPVKAHASPIEACESLLCLSGLQNHSKNPACLAPLNRFFSIQVDTPFFNPVLTALAREKYLNQCPEAYTVEKFVQKIIAEYGMIIMPPF